MIKRTEKEIEQEITRAEDCFDLSKFPIHTYEEGVADALKWVIGWSSSPPMDD